MGKEVDVGQRRDLVCEWGFQRQRQRQATYVERISEGRSVM